MGGQTVSVGDIVMLDTTGLKTLLQSMMDTLQQQAEEQVEQGNRVKTLEAKNEALEVRIVALESQGADHETKIAEAKKERATWEADLSNMMQEARVTHLDVKPTDRCGEVKVGAEENTTSLKAFEDMRATKPFWALPSQSPLLARVTHVEVKPTDRCGEVKVGAEENTTNLKAFEDMRATKPFWALPSQSPLLARFTHVEVKPTDRCGEVKVGSDENAITRLKTFEDMRETKPFWALPSQSPSLLLPPKIEEDEMEDMNNDDTFVDLSAAEPLGASQFQPPAQVVASSGASSSAAVLPASARRTDPTPQEIFRRARGALVTGSGGGPRGQRAANGQQRPQQPAEAPQPWPLPPPQETQQAPQPEWSQWQQRPEPAQWQWAPLAHLHRSFAHGSCLVFTD